MSMNNDQQKQLIQDAIASLDASHPANPKNLRFGAAVLTSKRNIYVSTAYWSVTLALALHAEQAALAHAAAHGERDIIAISCVSTEDEKREQFCHPCGIGKQLIYESSRDSGIDIQVVMANLKGDSIVKRISELVLFPWPAKTT
jgi:cytidine deaminase